MTSEEFQHIVKHGACVDLSSRAKFRLTGADRVRYLNGQVTNDVRKANAAAGLYACVTNAKGRMEGDVFIHAAPDDAALFLDAEPQLREPLAARLDRYIVADDVELADVTDDWRLWHFFGAAAEDVLRNVGDEALHLLKATRFGAAGLDVWSPKAADCGLRTADFLSENDVETWRICAGVPRWPNELNGETFPPEAGIENFAMDFTKGCYIGQEVLSRIKTTGKMPHRLVRFEVEDAAFRMDDSECQRDWKIGARTEDGGVKEIGAVTSFCVHPLLDRCVGLAYVRFGADVAHSVLLADAEAVRIYATLKII